MFNQIKTIMTIREFIKGYTHDVDVYVDMFGTIAYCGTQLTPEGEEEFKDILDLEMKGNSFMHDDAFMCEKAWTFFVSAAGYCPCSYYDRWFDDGCDD